MAIDMPTLDSGILAQEVGERFGLSQVQALLIADFIAKRVDAENRIYNATLLNKILIRLGEAKGAAGSPRAKIVAASVACAVGIELFFLNRKICRTPTDAARALGVDPRTFRREVRKSADLLEIQPAKPKPPASKAVAEKKAL